MRGYIFPVVIGLVVVLTLIQLQPATILEKSREPLPVLGELPELDFTDSSGQQFAKTTLIGTPSVLNFFFTSCPHICPKINAEVASLVRKYAKRGVQFVSISVDPEKDTPEVLREYKKQFDLSGESSWHLLTGEEQEKVRKLIDEQLRLASGVLPEGHTTRLLLIDSEGSIRGFYGGLDKNAFLSLTGDLEHLIEEH